MKLLSPHHPKGRRAIAMTEYLIILAIVAIAAIAIVGLFGKQIKTTFYRTTSTLGGTDAAGATTAGGISTAASGQAGSTDNMSNFDTGKNSAQ